jgi:archaellum biogenesis ATPase FlaH
LSQLRDRIDEFFTGKENAVAILDGIEYLSIHNDFRKLNIFFEELNDLVMSHQAILLIPVDPRVFDRCSLARLRRFAEVIC